jgi:hypothetical protein
MEAVAVGHDGTVFVADGNNAVVWALGPDGQARTVAGTGQAGFSGDRGPAAAAMITGPSSLAVNQSTRDLYVATSDHRIRRVDPGGAINTVAGNGVFGNDGDDGPAGRARIRDILVEMAVDARNGDLYFCDDRVIRKVDQSGSISRVAGNDIADADNSPSPPGRPALDTPVRCSGLGVDPRDGIVYFSDGYRHQIRRITRSGIVEVVAGSGMTEGSADGKKVTLAPMAPAALTIDGHGNIFFVSYEHGLRGVIEMIGAEPPRR